MYSGTITPLITPLDDTGAVSERCVGRLIDSLRGHVTALMPALSSGEGWVLTAQQWWQMVAATLVHSRGLPVLAGILLSDTSAVIRRAEQAVTLGVDGVVVTGPFGGEITQEQIYLHYAAIQSAVKVPLFVYNETAISGNHIELDTLVRICRLPGVLGIKESSGSPELTRRILDAVPQVPVFEGWEHLLLAAGDVAGFIGPLANLDPGLCNRMLADPTSQRQSEINDACARYGLHDDDWYCSVKAELMRRNILDTDRVALAAVERVPSKVDKW
jgi:4-hydroxy-tetrahydrodipicolinate synthase